MLTTEYPTETLTTLWCGCVESARNLGPGHTVWTRVELCARDACPTFGAYCPSFPDDSTTTDRRCAGHGKA